MQEERKKERKKEKKLTEIDQWNQSILEEERKKERKKERMKFNRNLPRK